MATIKKGTYRFNNELSGGCLYYSPLKFVCDGVSYFGFGNWSNTDNDFILRYGTDDELMSGPSFYYESTGWLDTKYQTITIPTDSEVTEEVCEWFTTNAVEQKQISGVWKLKDFPEIKFPEDNLEHEGVSFSFKCMSDELGGEIRFDCRCVHVPSVAHKEMSVQVYATEPDMSSLGWEYPFSQIISTLDGWRSAEFGLSTDPDTWDFGTEPQYVSCEFYSWLTKNATQPTTYVSYNGSNIANLFCGQTATIKCEGMKMESDVVVKVTKESGETIEEYDGTIIISGGLISFIFDIHGLDAPIEYQAECGMTWEEWCCSEYAAGSNIECSGGMVCFDGMSGVFYTDGTWALSGDVIVDGATYKNYT